MVPKQRFEFVTTASLLLALIALCFLVRIGVKYETGRLRSKAKQGLSVVKTSSRTRATDAVGMLPPNIGRDYRIQAHLQSEINEIEQTYRTLLAHLKHADSGAGDGLKASTLIKIFDLCTLYKDSDHALVQEWIAAYAPSEDLHRHLVNNLFDVGTASEEAGDISEAKLSYKRFLKLMHVASANDSLALETGVQRELTKAEIRTALLSPKHFFDSRAFAAFNRESPLLIESEMSNPDPSIHGLVILSLAAEKYHRDDYLAAIAYLQRYGQDCGPLRAECTFLSLKAKARESQSEQLQGVDKGRSHKDLLEAAQGFHQLFDTLPKGHYLRRQSLLWIALVERWSGNHTASEATLHQLVKAFPNTDTAMIAEDALGQDVGATSE